MPDQGHRNLALEYPVTRFLVRTCGPRQGRERVAPDSLPAADPEALCPLLPPRPPRRQALAHVVSQAARGEVRVARPRVPRHPVPPVGPRADARQGPPDPPCALAVGVGGGRRRPAPPRALSRVDPRHQPGRGFAPAPAARSGSCWSSGPASFERGGARAGSPLTSPPPRSAEANPWSCSRVSSANGPNR
jgi:hypothetical protein